MTGSNIVRHVINAIAPAQTNAGDIEVAFKKAGENDPVKYTPATVLTFLGTTMPSIQTWPRPPIGGKINVYKYIAEELGKFGYGDHFQHGDLVDGKRVPGSEEVARMTIADAIRTMKKGNPPNYQIIVAGYDLHQLLYLNEMRAESSSLAHAKQVQEAYALNS